MQVLTMKRYMLLMFIVVVIVLGHFATDAAMARGLSAVGNTHINKLIVYILFRLK